MSDTPPVTKWTEREANKAMEGLKDALRAAGIQLPSLGLEISRFHDGPASCPLVELGRARPDVVEALTEVIRRGVQ